MKKLSVFLGISLAAMTSQALAQEAIDQDQPDGSTYMAGFAQGDLAQSFMQAGDNISGADILLQEGVGSTDTVTISLWDNLPNAGGTMLTQGSTQGTAGTWAEVDWAPYAITPETTYYLVFTGNSTLGITGNVDNPYSRGQVYANSGFSSYPDFDYGFRTWTMVPAPSSLALMGLGGIAFARRRR